MAQSKDDTSGDPHELWELSSITNVASSMFEKVCLVIEKYAIRAPPIDESIWSWVVSHFNDGEWFRLEDGVIQLVKQADRNVVMDALFARDNRLLRMLISWLVFDNLDFARALAHAFISDTKLHLPSFMKLVPAHLISSIKSQGVYLVGDGSIDYIGMSSNLSQRLDRHSFLTSPISLAANEVLFHVWSLDAERATLYAIETILIVLVGGVSSTSLLNKRPYDRYVSIFRGINGYIFRSPQWWHDLHAFMAKHRLVLVGNGRWPPSTDIEGWLAIIDRIVLMDSQYYGELSPAAAYQTVSATAPDLRNFQPIPGCLTRKHHSECYSGIRLTGEVVSRINGCVLARALEEGVQDVDKEILKASTTALLLSGCKRRQLTSRRLVTDNVTDAPVDQVLLNHHFTLRFDDGLRGTIKSGDFHLELIPDIEHPHADASVLLLILLMRLGQTYGTTLEEVQRDAAANGGVIRVRKSDAPLLPDSVEDSEDERLVVDVANRSCIDQVVEAMGRVAGALPSTTSGGETLFASEPFQPDLLPAQKKDRNKYTKYVRDQWQTWLTTTAPETTQPSTPTLVRPDLQQAAANLRDAVTPLADANPSTHTSAPQVAEPGEASLAGQFSVMLGPNVTDFIRFWSAHNATNKLTRYWSAKSDKVAEAKRRGVSGISRDPLAPWVGICPTCGMEDFYARNLRSHIEGCAKRKANRTLSCRFKDCPGAYSNIEARRRHERKDHGLFL